MRDLFQENAKSLHEQWKLIIIKMINFLHDLFHNACRTLKLDKALPQGILVSKYC